MSTEDRLAILEHRMGAMESAFKEHLEESSRTHQLVLREIQANTRLTERVAGETTEIRAIWSQGTSALKFFNFLMRWAKRVALGLFVLFFVLFGLPYMLTHNGEMPTWLKALKQVLL